MPISQQDIHDSIQSIMTADSDNLGMLFLKTICENNVDGAKVVLAANPDVLNFQEKLGLSALHIAAFLNNAPMAHWLLEHDNIDPNISLNDLLATPLHLASTMGHTSVIEELIRCTDLQTNAVMENNKTALYIAVTERHANTAKLLLSAGANPNIPDSNNQYPIHWAAVNGTMDIMLDLLHYNADANMLFNGKTPLILAIQNDHLNIALEMIKSDKVNPDIGDFKGFTPLHLASAKGEAHLMSALFERNVNVNARAKDGSTPLHWAAFKQQIPAVSLLLDRADIDTYVKLNGKTPADLSVGSAAEQLFQTYYHQLKLKQQLEELTALLGGTDIETGVKLPTSEDKTIVLEVASSRKASDHAVEDDDAEDLYTMDKAWMDLQKEDYSAIKNLLGHNKTSMTGKKSGERSSIGATISERLENDIEPEIVLYTLLFVAHMKQKSHAIAEELIAKAILKCVEMDISHCDEYRGDIEDIIAIDGMPEFLKDGIEYAMQMGYGDTGEMTLVDYIISKGHAELLLLFKICGIEVPEVSEDIQEVIQDFNAMTTPSDAEEVWDVIDPAVYLIPPLGLDAD